MKKSRIFGAVMVLVLVSGAWGSVDAGDDAMYRGEFSVRFFGNGSGDIDRIKIPIDNPQVPADIGATNFTIEFWLKASKADNSGVVYPGASGDGWITGNTIIDRDIWGAGDYGDFGIAIGGDSSVPGPTDPRVVAFGVNNGSGGDTIVGSTDVADDAWHHVAVVRTVLQGYMAIYVDGGLDVSLVTYVTGDVSYRDLRPPTAPNDPFIVVGAEKHDTGSTYPSFNGYLDELRLSTTLRYSTAFAVPTAPFAPDSDTAALYHFNDASTGDCLGTVEDSSGNAGGPSDGICRFGGSPAGPLTVADSPFSVSPTPTPSAPDVPASSPAAIAVILSVMASLMIRRSRR